MNTNVCDYLRSKIDDTSSIIEIEPGDEMCKGCGCAATESCVIIVHDIGPVCLRCCYWLAKLSLSDAPVSASDGLAAGTLTIGEHAASVTAQVTTAEGVTLTVEITPEAADLAVGDLKIHAKSARRRAGIEEKVAVAVKKTQDRMAAELARAKERVYKRNRVTAAT